MQKKQNQNQNNKQKYNNILFNLDKSKHLKLPYNPFDLQKFKKKNQHQLIKSSKYLEDCLVLQQMEKYSKVILNRWIIDKNGGKIGRNADNNIVIDFKNVSRYHCQIFWCQETKKYFIKDLGSILGTFIRIDSQYNITEQQIIQIGQTQIRINLLQIKYQQNKYPIENNFTIGKHKSCSLTISKDQKIENFHTKIQKKKGKVTIIDMQTKSGTWKRLSDEKKISKQFQLQENMIIKIYPKCFKISKNIITKEESLDYSQLMCKVCKKNDQNAVLFPCLHCKTCSKCEILQCPQCNMPVKETYYLIIF